jgi:hypothetical protein
MSKSKKQETRLGTYLSDALDQESYNYLMKNSTELVNAIENELEAGYTPDAIRWYVSSQVGPDRQPLALRAEQAARYILRMQSG